MCLEDDDVDMKLPISKRREIGQIKKRVIWIYGAPFCGKTTFANGFPYPLMLNTDGNIKFVDAPFIAIKDEVKVTGRNNERVLAWKLFKDTISELEKKQNDFKTIIVDLLEDTYEYCRLYMYNEMGITHESDDSFRAWDKVRTEFLSTLKKLLNLDYENIILISHVDTSKDITKRSGDKITKIIPDLNEKCANKVAGMVDIVARVIAEDGNHTLNFKTSEVILGGGRFHVKAENIPLEFDELLKVYNEANVGKKYGPKAEESKEESREGQLKETKVNEMQKENKSKKSRKLKKEFIHIEKIEGILTEDETTNSEVQDTTQIEDKLKKRRARKAE
ncbi:MAG: ATP-binding protein [Clostridium sp.]